LTAPTTVRGWDQERRGQVLINGRAALLDQMPRLIRQAGRLTEDVRELIVDDAIWFTALDYEDAIESQEELERVFWDATVKRVRRAHEGRYDTVRAGHQRADIAALDTLAEHATVEDKVMLRAEQGLALDFASRLDATEQRIWTCQQLAPSNRWLGHASIARRLGLSVATVRKALQRIETKRERFAILHAAGRLCGFTAPVIAALAAGNAAAHEERTARAHLAHCSTCRLDYARQLRYLHSARFHAKVTALLPAPVPAERVRGIGIVRDWISDLPARIAGHDPGGTVAQVATGGAGRGLGTAAAVKLATLCLAGAGAVGACVTASGVLPLTTSHAPAHKHATPAPPKRSHAPAPAGRDTLPHGAPSPTPTPTPRHPTRRTRSSSTGSTQGGTGPRSHEQTPASPAPANAASNGASEFDPGYQPSKPKPAPAPAAPGSSEFF
jgi:hypothetical protein